MTVDRWIAIAQAWLPAFRHPGVCERLLEQAGCQAFRLWQEHLRQYARNPQQITLHEQCSLEESLGQAACPNPLGFVSGIGDRIYISPFITAKQHELAVEFGASDYMELVKMCYGKQPWRDIVDPLRRERQRLAFEERPVYERDEEIYHNRLRAQIEAESERYPRGEPGSFLPDGRKQAFMEASEQELGSLGFTSYTSRHVDYPAFDVRVSKDIFIRWSIEDAHLLFGGRTKCLVTPNLTLRASSYKGKLSAANKPEQYLDIPYPWLVGGYKETYMRAHDAREIRHVVHAHAVLVHYLWPFILSAINETAA